MLDHISSYLLGSLFYHYLLSHLQCLVFFSSLLHTLKKTPKTPQLCPELSPIALATPEPPFSSQVAYQSHLISDSFLIYLSLLISQQPSSFFPQHVIKTVLIKTRGDLLTVLSCGCLSILSFFISSRGCYSVDLTRIFHPLLASSPHPLSDLCFLIFATFHLLSPASCWTPELVLFCPPFSHCSLLLRVTSSTPLPPIIVHRMPEFHVGISNCL